MKETIVKNERKIQFVFKIAYLMLVIATFNSFLFMTNIQSLLVKICLVLAAGTFVFRMINLKRYIKMPYWQYLFLFSVSYLLSSLVNDRYGIGQNLKWLVWMALVFGILYMSDMECDTSYYRKEVKILSHIMLVYSLFAAIISLIMMITRYARLKEYPDMSVKAGYFWGRLWGVYTDPNYGATFCVAMIILSLYFYKLASKKWLKVFYIITIVFDFLYVIYSDSRTAQVSMFVGVGFWVFCFVWFYLKENSVKKRIVSAILVSVFAIVLMSGVMIGMKKIYINFIAPYIEENFSTIASDMEEVTKIELAQARENDKERDISNRRFDLWGSGIEVWKTSPLFGTGYTTFEAYALENVPETYSVNNDYGVFGNTHNQYINILVFQGVVGFIILLIFMKKVIFEIWPCIWKCEESEFLYIITLVSIIALIATSMMFLLEGLYTNSFGTYMLWYFLGVIIQYINKRQLNVQEGEKNGKCNCTNL